MRQKVGIAIAIAKKAKVLLLDEPTSGLDPKASNEFSEILKELASEGTTIFMATHDIFRAKEVADRIGIMKRGNFCQRAGKTVSSDRLEIKKDLKNQVFYFFLDFFFFLFRTTLYLKLLTFQTGI